MNPEARTAEPVTELTQIRPVVAHAPEEVIVRQRGPKGWLSRWRRAPANEEMAVTEDLRPRVRDAMNPSILLGDIHWTLADAHEFMVAHKIHHLPCVNDRRQLTGVVTREDILTWWLEKGETETLAHLVPRHPLLVTTPEATIADLVISMVAWDLRGVPVMTREGHLSGMITTLDISRLFLRNQVDGWA